uniref:NADH-ubiquinone oxidoreductase chain 6 n=1 Tax=Halocaridina rubra TaxID=373956 RepID=U5QQN8_HALRR|nr:NADH dehydrogenase subunit 6 [Halocaridina rubra]
MILATLSSALSAVFIKIKHPLTMGLMLLAQTVIIAVYINSILKTSWFSYILFLIFLGAMLVLFIYVTSLAPNEPFYFSNSSAIIFLSAALLSVTFLMIDPIFKLYPVNLTPSSITTSEMFSSNSALLCDMYNLSTMKMTLFLILYLLLTLVVVVKITSTHFGPLRVN